MLKSVLTGIILENIETLKYHHNVKADHSSIVETIFQYVANVIANFPWYFRLPVRCLAIIIGLLCLLLTGQKLNSLSSEKRSSFLRRVQVIPFSDMLSKLVRSMAFLKLFDIVPLTPDDENGVIIE